MAEKTRTKRQPPKKTPLTSMAIDEVLGDIQKAWDDLKNVNAEMADISLLQIEPRHWTGLQDSLTKLRKFVVSAESEIKLMRGSNLRERVEVANRKAIERYLAANKPRGRKGQE